MTRRIPVCLALMGTLLACGGNKTTDPNPVPQDNRHVVSFSAALDDPNRCTCNTGLRTYGVQVTVAGHLDAVATVAPADAQLVVRLLDNTINTVYAVSVQQGATARMGFDVVPGSYVVQVFLASDGPRTANFSLDVTYP
jgi:hypothetical protein